MAQAYPSIVKIETIGRSTGNREIPSVVLGGNRTARSRFLLVGASYGTHLSTIEYSIEFIRYVASHWNDDSIVELSTRVELIVLPTLNVDAIASTDKNPLTQSGIDVSRNFPTPFDG
jgi:hypothetical protein